MKPRTGIALLLLLLILSSISHGQYHSVQSNGLAVSYRIFGEGAPLLILGGGPGDVSDRYLSLCEGLSKHYRCILVDQRGTGRSTPPAIDSTTISIDLTLQDFEAIRKQLGLEQWNVLGFSYGGYLASLYTAFYPSSVSSLVLLSSMGLNTDVFAYFGDNITSRLWESDVASSNYWRDSARVAQNPKHALAERIRARMPGYFYDRKKSLIVSQAIKDSDFDVDMGNWVWNDVVKRNLDLTTMKTDFGKPVLILHGRQDPLGESVPQALSRYYKDSKLVFIEKCGHYSWVEQPEKVYAAIKSFLSGSYPGKKGR